MPRTIFTFIGLLLIGNQVFGQQLEGKYCDSDECLHFSEGQVSFIMQSNGGLSIEMRGKGTYSSDEDYFFISTNKYVGEPSRVNFIQRSDKHKLTVFDQDGNHLTGVYVRLSNSDDKTIYESTTDQFGSLLIPETSDLNSIDIRFVGYDNFSFNIDSPNKEKDINVYLASYQVIENELLTFQKLGETADNLRIVLLAITPSNNNPPNKKELKKAIQKGEKEGYRIRIFEKQ